MEILIYKLIWTHHQHCITIVQKNNFVLVLDRISKYRSSVEISQL